MIGIRNDMVCPNKFHSNSVFRIHSGRMPAWNGDGCVSVGVSGPPAISTSLRVRQAKFAFAQITVSLSWQRMKKIIAF